MMGILMFFDELTRKFHSENGRKKDIRLQKSRESRDLVKIPIKTRKYFNKLSDNLFLWLKLKETETNIQPQTSELLGYEIYWSLTLTHIR